MGRWGWRLFESDLDIDIACEFTLPARGGWKELPLSKLVYHDDILASPDGRANHSRQAHYVAPNAFVLECRERFDTGAGDYILDMYRARENSQDFLRSGKYVLVILVALMMRTGARIRPADLAHLRSIVPFISSHSTYAFPMFDEGFRDPGKVQFLAALDNYRAGVPRDFQIPSCFQCGRTQHDIRTILLECSGCKKAWYCHHRCQNQNRKAHKPNCAPREAHWGVNV